MSKQKEQLSTEEILQRFTESVKTASQITGLTESTCMEMLSKGWMLSMEINKATMWVQEYKKEEIENAQEDHQV